MQKKQNTTGRKIAANAEEKSQQRVSEKRLCRAVSAPRSYGPSAEPSEASEGTHPSVRRRTTRTIVAERGNKSQPHSALGHPECTTKGLRSAGSTKGAGRAEALRMRKSEEGKNKWT